MKEKLTLKFPDKMAVLQHGGRFVAETLRSFIRC